jgi:hypothetical protein
MLKRVGLEWDLLAMHTQSVANAVLGDRDRKAQEA